MILHHYSMLIHLPPICRDGLSRGDIAHHDSRVLHQAVSLTTQADPDRLRCWGSAPSPQNAAVRYVCRLPDGDAALEPALDTWRRLGVRPAFLKACNPNGQAKWWYFYFGVIPPESFTVELRGRDGYVPVAGPDLARVAAEVGADRDKYDISSPPQAPFLIYCTLKDEADPPARCLLGETHPAERLLAALTPAG